MQMSWAIDLKLLLKVAKESLIAGESINLIIKLLNNSAVPVRVEELSLSNNPLNFYAINSIGERFSGSLLSPVIRDGFIPPVIEKSFILLQPKTRSIAKIDLLNILGTLDEGDYKVVVTYSSEDGLFASSNTVSIKVVKSVPVYSKTLMDYFRANCNPIRTAWINREENRFHVFIMETSQYLPSNIKSNRRILQIDKSPKVIPAILGSPKQETEHLMWIEAETIKVASIHQRVLKDLRAIRLPLSNFQILEPPFTDANGTLYFLVMSKEGNMKNFQLVRYSFDGKIATEDMLRFYGDFLKYSVFYDSKQKLHMTWASQSGQIFYIWFDLEAFIKVKGRPKMLITDKPPILDLQIFKALKTTHGKLQLLLNYVNYQASNTLHSHLIDVNSKETVFHSFSWFPELKDLTLIQIILDLDCKPHFLFQDRHGTLWFKAFEGAKPVRATEENEFYPSNIDYPMLLVSSNDTRHYGIYLRYIKDKSRFIYKKLEKLT